MSSKHLLAWSLVALAALSGCDDPADSLQPAERSALTQLLGDRLENVAIVEEGEGDPTNLKRAEIRGGHIVSLSLHGMELTTTTPLAALDQLERLDVSNNQLSALDGLAGLSSLRELTASSNRIASATSLSGLSLTTLRLHDNQIADASALPTIDSLEELNLSYNPLGSLEGLPRLPALRKLSASGCELTSLVGLGARPALERLYVQSNSLTDLAGLEGSTALTRLYARHNEISDASMLAQLPALFLADLTGNELSAPPTVGERVQLELEDNPMRIEDPDRWVVAGMDLGPPPSPYVEELPTPRGVVGSSQRRCRHMLGDVDCRETLSRLTGFHELNLGGGLSSAPGGNITVRVGRGKVRLYSPWPTHDAWSLTEATPDSPIETSGTALPARVDQSLGSYAILIEAVDGTAEDVVVHFRTGSGL